MRYKFIVIYILFSFNGFSNETLIPDSIKLSNELQRLEKLLLYNYDSALYLSNFIAKKADSLKFNTIKEKAIIHCAYAHIGLGQSDSAINILAKELSKENKNRIFRIKTFNALAYAYNKAHKPNEAIECSIESQKLYKNADPFDLYYNIQINLGMAHKRLRNYAAAINILKSFLDEHSDNMNTPQKFSVFNNLGNCYATKKDYEKAEHYLNLAYNTIKNEAKTEKKSRITYNLGALYYRQKKFDLAEEFILKSLDICETLKHASQTENCYRALGLIQMDLKNYKEAEILLNKSLSIAKETKNPKSILGNYKNLYLTYKYQAEETDSKELLKKEFDYFKKWAYLNDSLYEVEMAEKILTLEKEYETEKKNNQINLLEKDNELKENTIKTQTAQRNSLLMVIGLALVVLSVFIYWYFYYKRVNKLLQLQSKRIMEQNEEISSNNDKLQKAINTRNKLFSIIAHDLRSPLTSMANFAKLINLYLRDNKLDAVNQMADQMNKKNTYVLELTDNLLSWARSQSEDLTPIPEKVSLLEIVEECLEIYNPVAEDKQIGLIFNEDNNHLVWSDRNMTKTIIRNLINNAIKYSKKGDEIIITTVPKAEFIEFIIRDNGIGMPEKEALLLFSSAKKIIKPGTNNEKSTGLGLSVCKEFTQALKGKIRVESKEGKGSTFFLTLPAYINQDGLKKAIVEYDFSDKMN